MSKGAVAKKYQPYRKLAEEQALKIAELESELALWRGRAETFRKMYENSTGELRASALRRYGIPQ
jgi:hypothetical protein